MQPEEPKDQSSASDNNNSNQWFTQNSQVSGVASSISTQEINPIQPQQTEIQQEVNVPMETLPIQTQINPKKPFKKSLMIAIISVGILAVGAVCYFVLVPMINNSSSNSGSVIKIEDLDLTNFSLVDDKKNFVVSYSGNSIDKVLQVNDLDELELDGVYGPEFKLKNGLEVGVQFDNDGEENTTLREFVESDQDLNKNTISEKNGFLTAYGSGSGYYVFGELADNYYINVYVFADISGKYFNSESSVSEPENFTAISESDETSLINFIKEFSVTDKSYTPILEKLRTTGFMGLSINKDAKISSFNTMVFKIDLNDFHMRGMYESSDISEFNQGYTKKLGSFDYNGLNITITSKNTGKDTIQYWDHIVITKGNDRVMDEVSAFVDKDRYNTDATDYSTFTDEQLMSFYEKSFKELFK